MDTEDKIEATKIENINIVSLKDYFIALDELEDICDDLVECYKKEEKYYLEEDKFNMILEEESELVEALFEMSSDIKKEFKDILDAFRIRATERQRIRRVAISRELSKKPRAPKEN
ncbi:hypothetical protein KM1_334420 [Entamoeba histolytica HM-3:IMSS]|uniref:Uncharacterized protein n=3 Tax=Entamoeba histolytica TaxID=5759 RepID=C4M868_ENTH1|nr:hypothetical protein EHI_020980 [Entamoeba histolytica HM-1:IMSS]EAL49425.1 hypothetical protein EHI_020980 [Entamoeba histolytica HM-1:IMSS]EMS13204.1 hypothetical protein KM1_334420 [Entamoeba histolytica HM-3:IMSS]GAT97768.1 hypothetical protein CL6EHI_020980 [Entamoeba histolytica]|eukprot:XP_654811.1 hypothetical protein EHI_020980 [Entamoeba histolytica HM-1:IMSS]